MLKKLLIVLTFASLTVGGVLAAAGQGIDNPRATILLKSGERVTGEIQDVQQDAVLVWRNRANTRRIPIRDIVVVDFSGNARNLPAAEYVADRPGEHVLVLEDGTSLTGQFVDTSLWMTFRTEDGRELHHRVSDISRLYYAEPPWAEASGSLDRFDRRTELTVPADTQWTPTGIRVRDGEMVAFSARGEIVLSRTPNDVAQPAGSTMLQRTAPNAPLRHELAGALIGRVDNSEPFGIGDQTQPLRMPATGQLYLGINDDGFIDNKGAFEVVVTRRSPS